jgi:putative transposase
MMPEKEVKARIPLPKNWPENVKSAVLETIGLAQYATAHTRGWAANSPNARIRLTAENDRLKAEVALLREEIRIKDARIRQLAPHQRPNYPPAERMAILQLKTARNWSLEQTAKTFLVTAATISSWMRRLEDKGADALVQLPGEPPNKFPQLVSKLVKDLKACCPPLGKVKLAQILARAGLHLAASTVGRMLKENGGQSVRTPPKDESPAGGEGDGSVVTAKRRNHVWHVDLTVVPTGPGLYCPWLPRALPQRWPFVYWVAAVVDHFSRRVMGSTALTRQPTSIDVRAFLGRAIARAKATPKYIICDRGPQFDCSGFRDWCKRKGIKPPRYGAVGQHGSIAVVERFILTLKCLLRCLLLIPYRREAFHHELDLAIGWYNAHRPHMTLGGRTPNEVYYDVFPANRKPRLEPRPRWPRGSRCARPWALVRGSPGARLDLKVAYHHSRRHLPIVTLSGAA